ncbi:MAG TPA: glycine zipper family protein [bacterium]|mgnify:CR=1 FL=1|nr:glycine zipper family protein [bacterium]
MNKIALGVSFGFTGGAIFGIILGLLTKDFAVWLAVGVGFGMIIGSSVGLFLKNTKRN